MDDLHARLTWSAISEPEDPASLLVASLGPSEALDHLRSGALNDHEGLTVHVPRWLHRLETVDKPTVPEGTTYVYPGHEAWPGSLDDLGPAAPIGLWVRGRVEVLASPTIAIVGSRACTSYGRQIATELATDLGSTHAIAAGGAYGIDAAAHRATLASGGVTTIVMASGVDTVYPRPHTDLVETTVIAGGAIVSEYPPGQPPARYRFLARNRLIAALGDATVVVEASARSGALNTLRRAGEIGRRTGAVPGPVTAPSSAGTLQAIADGASIVRHAWDVRELVGPITADRVRVRSTRLDLLPPDQHRIWDTLSPGRLATVSAIAADAGLSPTEAHKALTELAKIGMVRILGERWHRVVS